MSPHAEHARRTEAAFLAGVEGNLARDGFRALGATSCQVSRFDESAAVRAALAARRMFDRELPAKLPQNARVVWKGYRRRWWLARRRTQVAIASVLAPPEAYLDAAAEGAPPPVDLRQVVEHVQRIAPDRDVPHVIGLCCPSGFSPQVRSSPPELPNVTLVLVEPRPDGGWTVTLPGPRRDERLARLFDPDTTAQKVRRARDAVAARSAELLTGGLSAAELANQLSVPADAVIEAFHQSAAEDGDLRVRVSGGDALLFRGAASTRAKESDMSVGDWIRQLFGLAGNEAKKINALSERRAELSQRRDRLYEDIARLEQREKDFLEQGRQTTSPVVRRRVASQLAQHRREMNRLNTMASMLSQQINVLSTHIHNLTLIQQGQVARLPSSEELTNDAVRAEEILEQLKADMDLVGTLESGAGELLTTPDELEILKEFEQADAKAAPPQAARGTPAAEAPAAEPKPREKNTPEAT